jgi:hypothetical protein
MNELAGTVTLAMLLALVQPGGGSQGAPPAQGDGTAGVVISQATVRDSAGVVIVQNGAVTSARAAFSVASNPSVALGGLRADLREELRPAVWLGMVRMSDGRLIVNDVNSLKVFDARGNFLKEVGRSGQGPGEFVQTHGVCGMRGDSLLVFGNGRVSVYDAQLTLVRVSGTWPWYWPDPDTCALDGSFLVAQNSRPNPHSKLPPAQARYLDLVSDLARYNSLGHASAQLGIIRGGSPLANGPELQVASTGANIVVGDGSRPEFQILDASGKLTRIVRWTDVSDPIPDALQNMSGGGGVGSAARSGAASPSARPTIEAFAYYQAVRVDQEGRVWVVAHERGPHKRRWTVFTPAGQMLGTVMLPDVDARGRSAQV